MTKPTNPYRKDTSSSSIWANGFSAGQKSMFTPLSVTGRWWQAANGKVFFVNQDDYKSYQHAADNYPDRRWLTDEETREFT